MAYFIPLRTEEHMKKLGLIFLKESWRLQGFPETIISARDTRFTSKFWMSLMQLLQVKLNISTGSILKPMGKLKGSTRQWNSTYAVTVRISSRIGCRYSLLRSTPITFCCQNPLRLGHLKSTKDSLLRHNGRGWCLIIKGYTETVNL